MTKIIYLKGDATHPQGEGVKIITHICNDIGGWGKGFVLALSARWKAPEAEYRKWHKSAVNFDLGETQFVRVEDEIYVANMIAQKGIYRTAEGPPIRYDALSSCLKIVAQKAAELGACVHMPRIGCGLAGGCWDRIEPIISDTLLAKDVPVYVYDL